MNSLIDVMTSLKDISTLKLTLMYVYNHALHYYFTYHWLVYFHLNLSQFLFRFCESLLNRKLLLRFFPKAAFFFVSRENGFHSFSFLSFDSIFFIWCEMSMRFRDSCAVCLSLMTGKEEIDMNVFSCDVVFCLVAKLQDNSLIISWWKFDEKLIVL